MVFSIITGCARAYLDTRAEVRRLFRCTDRELDDLGLTRVELAAVGRRYFVW